MENCSEAQRARAPSFGGVFVLLLLLPSLIGQASAGAWHWEGWRAFARGGDPRNGDVEPASASAAASARDDEAPRATKFDIDAGSFLGTDNPRGRQFVERSTSLMSQHSCWHVAYSAMFRSCKDILRDDNRKSRLALRLTDCFLRTSGRTGVKICEDNVAVSDCVKALDDHTHAIFLAFFIDSASMCHYLQSQEFKVETEKVVNDLKHSAHTLESKLGSMNEQLDVRHSEVIEQTENILQAQQRLQNEHAMLQSSIERGMQHLQEAADEAQRQLDFVGRIQKEIARSQQMLADNLASELAELQSKSSRLGTSMSHLHVSLGELTEKSLSGQAKLLLGQEEALEGLTELQRSQVAAIEESRASMQDLAAEAYKHQQEFRTWQYELDEMHRRLANGSVAMLKAQESFVLKQAAVFTTLEKLFSLHNTILLESRAYKAALVYFFGAVFVFMATTTNHTQNARLLLYCGMAVTIAMEIWLIRFMVQQVVESERFVWLQSRVFWLRASYGVLTLAYLIYCVCTFRDYDKLNYQMLRDIQENIATRNSRCGGDCQTCYPEHVPRRLADHESDMAKKPARRTRSSTLRPPKIPKAAAVQP